MEGRRPSHTSGVAENNTKQVTNLRATTHIDIPKFGLRRCGVTHSVGKEKKLRQPDDIIKSFLTLSAQTATGSARRGP